MEINLYSSLKLTNKRVKLLATRLTEKLLILLRFGVQPFLVLENALSLRKYSLKLTLTLLL